MHRQTGFKGNACPVDSECVAVAHAIPETKLDCLLVGCQDFTVLGFQSVSILGQEFHF